MFGCCSSRSGPRSPSSMDDSGAAMPSNEGGGKIGVSFACDERGVITVQSLAPGGAAEASGCCVPGDVLVDVDGVVCRDLPDLYRRVAGPVGSTVHFHLRGAHGDKRFPLVRRAATTLASPSSDSYSDGGGIRGSYSSSSKPQLAPSSRSDIVSYNNNNNNNNNNIAPNSSSSYGGGYSGRPGSGNGTTPSYAPSSFTPPSSSGPQSAVTSLRNSGRLPPATDVVGVGINFMHTADGRMSVKSLLPGGPAALAGGIAPGDVLVDVGGTNVESSSVDHIAQLVLGPRGSSVMLGFKSGAGSVKRVNVRRDWTVPEGPVTQ